MNRLCKATYFTKFDVQWGFNNLRLREGDKWKAVFRTNRGLFKPLVMFFGLTNSPATFQRMMDSIFKDLVLSQKVIVNIDDILIFLETLEEHREIVQEVLQCLRKNHLYLKLQKCAFEATEVDFLGVIVGNGNA